LCVRTVEKINSPTGSANIAINNYGCPA